MKPWEFHSDLTEDRLVLVGQKLAEARHAVFDLFDERGDDAWSLGCRAFSWCRKTIVAAASEDELDWLNVIDPSKQFIFRIGDVPIRFFRGDSEAPIKKTMSTVHREAVQLSLEFPDEPRALLLIWRFVIETDEQGDLVRIVFVGATPKGVSECIWEVPLFDAELDDLQVQMPLDDGEDLPEPSVGLPGVDDAANE